MILTLGAWSTGNVATVTVVLDVSWGSSQGLHHLSTTFIPSRDRTKLERGFCEELSPWDPFLTKLLSCLVLSCPVLS